MHRREWDVLFSEYDLRAILENQLRSINDRVLAMPKARFESDSDEQIAASVASELVVEPLAFSEDEISVESEDVKVDVSHDFNRAVFDRSRPAYVDGIEVTYHLPFSGDPELVKCRGNRYTFNPPRAVIGKEELLYPYSIPGREVAATKKAFDEDLRVLREWVPWINEPVTQYNSNLESKVRQRVIERRAELTQTAADLGSLGFRVRKSAGDVIAPVEESKPERRNRNRAKAEREYDVALSFAGEDRAYVSEVARRLKELDVKVFYDDFERIDLWGKDLTAHLADVYARSSRFVVIFASKHYAAKAWPNHERAAALSRQFAGQRDRVLPVRIDQSEIPGLPSTVGYLDTRALTPDKLAELIRQKVDTDES